MEKYECKKCINRASPLCEKCTIVTSPGGVDNKPRYFIKEGEITYPSAEFRFPCNKDATLTKKAYAIAVYLCNAVPIPTKLIMEYNSLAEEE